jgi:mycothiol system anti-sigma-R factor
MNNDHLRCEDVIEQLFAYLDRDLDDASSAKIQRHLARCRDCFTRAEFEKRLRAKVREAGAVDAPARLHGRIKGLLDRF